MIDRIPQRFQVRMLVDHRGAQISVTHNVANQRWILCLCHRVRAERMSSVVQNNLLGNPKLLLRRWAPPSAVRRQARRQGLRLRRLPCPDVSENVRAPIERLQCHRLQDLRPRARAGIQPGTISRSRRKRKRTASRIE